MTTGNAGERSEPAWGRRRQRSQSSLFAAGEPLVWLTGGALCICVVMVLGLLSLVLAKGLATFWPKDIVLLETLDGRVYMGEKTRQESYRPAPAVIDSLPGEIQQQARERLAARGGSARRELIRTGNFRLTQSHFSWISDFEVAEETYPTWAVLLERLEGGRFYGFPEAWVEIHPAEQDERIRELLLRHGEHARLVIGDETRFELRPPSDFGSLSGVRGVAVLTAGPEAAWTGFEERHRAVREHWKERRRLEKVDIGQINHQQEKARLKVRRAELAQERAARSGPAAAEGAATKVAEAEAQFQEVLDRTAGEFERIRQEIRRINTDNSRFQLLVRTAGEGAMEAQQVLVRLDDIVRGYPANQLSWSDRVAIYLSRWREFLWDEPREANSAGGVYPAIFGTVAMTLIMSIAVVPFGILAALYLKEYATAGPVVSTVRIAVNNLAGVPSIVFGVFGLGFFCYVMGAGLDELLFAARLPNPTLGKGGLLWASLTLALLTLPVVIVATEEAISAVPNSMREGSYACGASKWQTIRRIVLPRALPGIITGMILAIARGAGEVAPLMLVGAVKLAPELPIDGMFPFLHPERSFMHLGFHIYDVGFQSQDSEAAKPMVFTTTLLLIAIVAVLNLATIWLRSKLRKKYAAGKF